MSRIVIFTGLLFLVACGSGTATSTPPPSSLIRATSPQPPPAKKVGVTVELVPGMTISRRMGEAWMPVVVLSDRVVTGNSFYGGPATVGTNTYASLGMTDMLITAFDLDGKLLWARHFGTPENDPFVDMVAGPSGEIVVTGGLAGSLTFGLTALAPSDGLDVFAAALSSGGDWLWATRLAEPGRQIPYSIATGSDRICISVSGGKAPQPFLWTLSPSGTELGLVRASRGGFLDDLAVLPDGALAGLLYVRRQITMDGDFEVQAKSHETDVFYFRQAATDRHVIPLVTDAAWNGQHLVVHGADILLVSRDFAAHTILVRMLRPSGKLAWGKELDGNGVFKVTATIDHLTKVPIIALATESGLRVVAFDAWGREVGQAVLPIAWGARYGPRAFSAASGPAGSFLVFATYRDVPNPGDMIDHYRVVLTGGD